MNINELIANEKYDAAAAIFLQALLELVNTSAPEIQLTKAEFAKIAPTVSTKLASGKILATKVTTPDIPGDDVEPTSATAELKITFSGPEDDADFPTITEVIKQIRIGGTYNYAPPSVDGYTADKILVTGKMTDEGVNVEVKYTKDAKEETTTEEPKEETTTTPKAKHALSIEYVGPTNDEDFTAPDDHLSELEEGAEYSVISPTVEGYAPDKATVAGTMGTADVEVTVTYRKIDDNV